MAQITLTLSGLNQESFKINDYDIIYINASGTGSAVTIIDTANVDTVIKYVTESPSDIAALTDKLVQVTLTNNQEPYIAILRIKDIITVNSLANILYDNQGGVFQLIKTSMTAADVITAIKAEENQPLKYVAFLTQSGTAAPVATVLENTLGGVPVWTYDSVGNYVLTLTGAFTIGKTFYSNPSGANATSVFAIDANYSDDELYLIAYTSGTPADSIFGSGVAFTILVYP